jgi:hypothetical protein
MTTYRYAIQQRPQQVMLADVTITDPSPQTIAYNARVMAGIQSACVAYMKTDVWDKGTGTDAPGLTGFILFESIDGFTIWGNPKTPIMMGYTMSAAHADAIVKMLNDGIVASAPVVTLPPPKHHKKGG